ncbi:MAG: 50S ribosomal protein L6, partial [Azoarcus sp.]|nr:50S ribosomal protein L6 [Azoarcus sp.]
MSRVGKNPVAIPGGVEIRIAGNDLSIKGPLGELSRVLHPSVAVEREGDTLLFKPREGAVNGNAFSGTMRALVNNMVTGVTKGFERKLNLVGVGYRAQAQEDRLNLSLGFSHPVV